MTGWSHVSLAELTEKPQYGAIASGSDDPAAGPLFVRQTDIDDGFINWASVPYCDLEPGHFNKYALRADDLLVARLGSVGRAARVRDAHNAVFAGYLVRFRVADPTRVDSRFLEYQLRSPAWWQHVHAVRSGAVQPTLNAKQMGAFEFALPPIEEQFGIAETLGVLDDKIESNRRLVTSIPALIRATVEASLDDEAEVLPVVGLAEFVNGGAYTKGASGTGRMVIRIKDLNSGPSGSTVYNDVSVPDNKTARPGDLLMSWSGSLGVYRWSRDEAIINQHIFKVLPKGLPAWLVFDRLEAVIEIFQGIAKDKATTMGHIQRGHLASTTIEVPTTSAIERLDERLGPIWERLLLAEREIHRLESLRDALLPELLSGRLRVPEAEVAA